MEMAPFNDTNDLLASSEVFLPEDSNALVTSSKAKYNLSYSFDSYIIVLFPTVISEEYNYEQVG